MKIFRWFHLQYVRRRRRASRKDTSNASADLIMAIWSQALLSLTRNATWLQIRRDEVAREPVSVRYIKSDYIRLGSMQSQRGTTVYYLHPWPRKNRKRHVVLVATKKGFDRTSTREIEFTKLPYGQLVALNKMAAKLVRQLPSNNVSV
jgi:hypothetical protein